MDNKTSKAKILLVEDDESMGFLVKEYLEMMHYDVTLLTEGGAVAGIFEQGKFHLCLLDVMLPQKDGFAIAADIRRFDAFVPIIFLTAKNLKDDRLRGFHLGGDDYVTKPFSIEELHLRIEAVLKRVYTIQSRADAQHVIKFGKTQFDTTNQRLLTEGVSTDLTYREAKLLQFFCRHKNQLLDRDAILKAVWEDEGIVVSRSVDVFVSRLRKLLQNDPSVKFVNIHSVGYRFEVLE
jgi:two-component system, OmpR family, response regulator